MSLLKARAAVSNAGLLYWGVFWPLGSVSLGIWLGVPQVEVVEQGIADPGVETHLADAGLDDTNVASATEEYVSRVVCKLGFDTHVSQVLVDDLGAQLAVCITGCGCKLEGELLATLGANLAWAVNLAIGAFQPAASSIWAALVAS